MFESLQSLSNGTITKGISVTTPTQLSNKQIVEINNMCAQCFKRSGTGMLTSLLVSNGFRVENEVVRNMLEYFETDLFALDHKWDKVMEYDDENICLKQTRRFISALGYNNDGLLLYNLNKRDVMNSWFKKKIIKEQPYYEYFHSMLPVGSVKEMRHPTLNDSMWNQWNADYSIRHWSYRIASMFSITADKECNPVGKISAYSYDGHEGYQGFLMDKEPLLFNMKDKSFEIYPAIAISLDRNGYFENYGFVYSEVSGECFAVFQNTSIAKYFTMVFDSLLQMMDVVVLRIPKKVSESDLVPVSIPNDLQAQLDTLSTVKYFGDKSKKPVLLCEDIDGNLVDLGGYVHDHIAFRFIIDTLCFYGYKPILSWHPEWD